MSYSERIPLRGTRNTRDLGGYIGLEGRKVKTGLIYRSDSLSFLEEDDVAFLAEQLQLRYDIDLRSEQETEEKPDVAIPGCRLVLIPITSKILMGSTVQPPAFAKDDPEISWHYRRLYSLHPDGDAIEGMKNLYLHYVEMESNRCAYTEFLNLVADAEGPLIFHCADGKDRTGMAAAYLLSILGVDRETILDDYEASAGYLVGKCQERAEKLRAAGIADERLIRNMCLLASVKRCWLEAALERIDNAYGGMDRYLTEVLYIDEGVKQRIRQKYLD